MDPMGGVLERFESEAWLEWLVKGGAHVLRAAG